MTDIDFSGPDEEGVDFATVDGRQAAVSAV